MTRAKGANKTDNEINYPEKKTAKIKSMAEVILQVTEKRKRCKQNQDEYKRREGALSKH